MPKPRGAPGAIQNRYLSLAAAGEIESDPSQIAAAEKLDAVASALAAWEPPSSGLMSVFGRRRRTQVPRGLYLHGSVGRGKTMLMDLFFQTIDFKPSRRIHFHEFMAEVHEQIGEARKTVDGDPIPHVGRRLARSARVLCFDELHVTDIADAMILGRLFKVMFEAEVVVIATSNAAPHELYRNGLNRQLFLPFIGLIEQFMVVHELEAAKDYRLSKLAGEPLYFQPADAPARAQIDRLWQRLTGGQAPMPVDLTVKGRTLHVPASAMGVARFGFGDLCEKPLGSLDYLHVAHAFHTVIIEDIPILTPNRRDVARRFINLIDTLYDNRVSLIASAAAEPDDLYRSGDGAELFQRTASRLIEMRSEAYQEERASRAAASASGGVGAGDEV